MVPYLFKENEFNSLAEFEHNSHPLTFSVTLYVTPLLLIWAYSLTIFTFVEYFENRLTELDGIGNRSSEVFLCISEQEFISGVTQF